MGYAFGCFFSKISFGIMNYFRKKLCHTINLLLTVLKIGFDGT
jgi:hypothetical protein